MDADIFSYLRAPFPLSIAKEGVINLYTLGSQDLRNKLI